MSTMKVQTLKGFRDFLPSEARKRQYVINTLKGVFELYGFEPLETPALEYEEVLLGKYGEEGDKLMYRFEDNGGRKVALRYDQTVPLARVVAEYQDKLPFPFKRYQIQPVWRAENTQKGRFREFLQCDIDTIGLDSLYADAEIIACTISSLETLGFKNFKVLINDRAIFSDLTKDEIFRNYNIPTIIRIIDKLNKIGQEGVIEELAEKVTSGDKSWATSILCSLEETKPTKTLKTIFTALEDLGADKNKYEFSPTLARGLDYYTGMIFEVEIEDYLVGSIVGGGRYDDLIGMFSSNKILAVGCAFGFDRIMEAMDQLGLFPDDLTTTKVLVTIFNKKLIENSIELADRLRVRGINAELWLDTESKLDKQLKYADQKGIPYVVIIGPDEAKNSTYTIRNMRTKKQENVSEELLLDKFKV